MLSVRSIAMYGGLVTKTASSADGEGGAEVDASEDPRIVVAFHGREPHRPGWRIMLRDANSVVLGRGDTRELVRTGDSIRVSMCDPSLSREHVQIRQTPRGWELKDTSKNGSVLNGATTRRALLADGDLIEAGSLMVVFREFPVPMTEPGDRDLDREKATPLAFRTLTLELEAKLQDVAKIARSSLPVLIGGPTGSGKELVARAIHETSGRPGGFVAVNCGALPRGLVEGELFGYRRGAFTGANSDREGLVRRANHGTLFLDEIAELPDDAQASLLRVLQEGEVRPLGGDLVGVDIRIVAATHQDLKRRIHIGRFREDLYARLSGFAFELPSLQDRRDDIGSLIAVMLSKLGADPKQVSFRRAAARALMTYPYPHNVRELEHAVRHALVLSNGDEIRIEHLPEPIRTWTPQVALELEQRARREQLIELLRASNGNVSAVARSFKKAPAQVRRWCRTLEIDLADFRS